MKINLVSIGNSKGVRLPASVIEQCGFGERLEMRVRDNTVVLVPMSKAREGWNEAFEKMAARGDDALVVSDAPESSFDAEDWTW